MRLMVIGGVGFIGRRVVRSAAAKGYEVVNLDIASAAGMFDDLGTQVVSARLDLTVFEDVVAAMITHKPEVVINLSYMRDTLPRPAMKLNVLGMDNCFEAARLCEVPRVVYSSSIAVNGSQAPYGPRKILETDAPCPKTQYAHHKVFNEFQAKEYRDKHGMTITGLRAAHISGVDKTIGSVDHVECIVKAALGQKALFDYRDRMRCIVHGDDIAEVFLVLAAAAKPKHPLYYSGGETMSLGQLADKVSTYIPDADIGFKNETGGEQRSGGYLFDDQRLVDEFGISYPPYEQTLGRMIAAVRRGSSME